MAETLDYMVNVPLQCYLAGMIRGGKERDQNAPDVGCRNLTDGNTDDFRILHPPVPGSTMRTGRHTLFFSLRNKLV